MKLNEVIIIVKRLYGEYVKKYIVAHDTHQPNDALYWCLSSWGEKNGWAVKIRNRENVGFTVLEKL